MPDANQPPRLSPEQIRRIMEAAREHAGEASAPPPPAPEAPVPPPAPEAAAPAAKEASVPPEDPRRTQAATLHQQAIADLQQGKTTEARARLEQSLELERGIGAPADMAATLVMLGQILFSQNEREPGLAMARESLTIFQNLDAPEATQVGEIVAQMESLVRQDAPGGSRDLLRQGIAALQEGDGQLAGDLLESSLNAAVAAGDGNVAAGALHHLGLLLFSAGHLEQAQAALRDSIELNRTLGDDPALAAGLAVLGQVLVERGEQAEGLRVLRESLITWNAAQMPEQAAQTKALIAEIKAASGGPAPSA
ncbi:MAG: tetratricopeptide repeat protein [Thermomicrobiales bacterium]